MNNFVLAALFVCAITMLPTQKADAQDINYRCIVVGIQEAAQYQCKSPNWLFCKVETVAAGFGAYLDCSQQQRIAKRQYRQQRRARRNFVYGR